MPPAEACHSAIALCCASGQLPRQIPCLTAIVIKHLRLQKEVPLGNPDVLVCSVGTEIFFKATGASPEANQEWKAELDQGWSRQEAIDAAAKFSELKPQVPQITI